MTTQVPNSPDASPTLVSRHITSEGVLVYLRTPEGALQARLHRWSGGSQPVLDSGRRPERRAC